LGSKPESRFEVAPFILKKYRRRIIDVSPVEYIGITINGGYNGWTSERSSTPLRSRF
jgi:hypothetical protein